MESNLIVAVVTEKNQSNPKPGSSYGVSTFLTLSDGIKVIAPCSLDKLPADGAVAAFYVKSSRSGKMGVVTAWGWPQVAGKGSLNKKEGELTVKLVGDFGSAQVHVSAGLTE